MKISTSFSEITRAYNAVQAVVADKLLQEDLKTLTIWKNGDKLSIVASNAFVSALTEFDAEILADEGEEIADEVFIQLKASELKNIMGTYSGLHLTEITKMVFDIRSNTEIRLEVYEEAVNKDDEHFDKFKKTIKHRMMRVRVTENMKREIHNFITNTEVGAGEQMIQLQTAEILGYIEPLLPAIAKFPNDTIFSRLFFLSKYVFIIPQTYAAVIENRMDDDVKAHFSEFVLTTSVTQFLKSFLSLYQTVGFCKKITGDVVNLIFQTNETTAMVRAYNTKKVPNLEDGYNIQPDNFISLDRKYFADVLKRISNSNADVTFRIKITEDGGSSCEIINAALTQEVPVYKSKGEGEYLFTLNSDLLASLVFNNMIDCYGDRLVFRLDHNDDGKVNFYVMDNTKGWHTKMQGLSLTKSDLGIWDK